MPNQTYSVCIWAYTTELLHNQSFPLIIVTPPNPDVKEFIPSTIIFFIVMGLIAIMAIIVTFCLLKRKTYMRHDRHDAQATNECEDNEPASEVEYEGTFWFLLGV